MTCPNCSAAVAPGDKFCPRCGVALGTPTATTGAWNTPPEAPTAPDRSEYIYGAPPSITGAGVVPPYTPPPPPYGAAPSSPYSAPPAAPYGTLRAAPTYGAAPAAAPYGPPPAHAAPTQGYSVPAVDTGWRPPDTLAPVARVRAPVGLLAGLGLLALIVLMVAAVFLLSSTRPQSLAGATARPGGTAVMGGTLPNDAEGRAIVAAIEANNAAQITAFHTLNAKVLDGKMSGKALQDNLTSISDLQQKGQYEDARLLKIDYQPARILNANEASIRTVEQWESSLHNKDGSLVQAAQTQTLYEVYYLVRQSGQWVVNQVDISQTPDGTPVQ